MIYTTDTTADQILIAKAVAHAAESLVQDLTAAANANPDDTDAQHAATEAAQALEDLRRELRRAEAA